jgi:hypothetical protein
MINNLLYNVNPRPPKKCGHQDIKLEVHKSNHTTETESQKPTKPHHGNFAEWQKDGELHNLFSCSEVFKVLVPRTYEGPEEKEISLLDQYLHSKNPAPSQIEGRENTWGVIA